MGKVVHIHSTAVDDVIDHFEEIRPRVSNIVVVALLDDGDVVAHAHAYRDTSRPYQLLGAMHSVMTDIDQEEVER